VRAAPAVSRANAHKETHTSIQVQRRQSGLPCAMVLRLMPRSPRRRIRSCHRHRRINGLADPGRVRKTSADLASATDARTTRFCRTPQRRSSARRECAHETSLNREPRPAIHFLAPTLPRPPHSDTHVRDDRDTPLLSGRNDEIDTADFSRRPSGIFFEAGLDRFSREGSDLPVG
jgi:hypothetical protein